MKSLLYIVITLCCTQLAVAQTYSAADDMFNATGDSSLSVSPPGLLENDTVVEGDSFAVYLMDPAGNGEVTLAPDGSFTYIPDTGFVGTDSFTYFIESIPSTIQSLAIDTSNSFIDIDMTVTFLFSSRQDMVRGRITGGTMILTDTNEAPFSTAQIQNLDVVIVDSLALDFDFGGDNQVFARADTNSFSLSLLEPGPMAPVLEGSFEQQNNTVLLSGLAKVTGSGFFEDIITDAIPDSNLVFDVEDVISISGMLEQLDEITSMESSITIQDTLLLDESGLASVILDVKGTIIGTGAVNRPVQSNVATVTITVEPPATNTSTDLEVPLEYTLSQNYPNPFNPTTSIAFSVPAADHVTLKVYDMLGREVRTLVEGMVAPGAHQIQFEAGNLPSGMYLYRMETGAYTDTKTLMLVK